MARRISAERCVPGGRANANTLISAERRVPGGRAAWQLGASPAHLRRNFQQDRREIRSVLGSDPWVACVARSRELMLKGVDLLQPALSKTHGGLLRGPADFLAPRIPQGLQRTLQAQQYVARSA